MSKTSDKIFEDINHYLAAFDIVGKQRPKRIAVTRKAYNSLLAFYNHGIKEKDQLKKVPPIDGREVFIYEP